jgi:hypothetical protein
VIHNPVQLTFLHMQPTLGNIVQSGKWIMIYYICNIKPKYIIIILEKERNKLICSQKSRSIALMNIPYTACKFNASQKNSSQLTCVVGLNLVFPKKKAPLNCQLVEKYMHLQLTHWEKLQGYASSCSHSSDKLRNNKKKNTTRACIARINQ